MRTAHFGWKRTGLSLVVVALLACLAIGLAAGSPSSAAAPSSTQFVFTSDPHYGIIRATFRGAKDVDAHTVNAALVAAMNGISDVKLPCDDGGVNACQQVGAIDFVAEGGDIANRSEAMAGAPGTYSPSSADSWALFETDYIKGISLKDKSGNKAPLYIVPGNHDVTNAIGFYKTMVPPRDATAIAQIYNLMLKPATPRTKDTYDYATDKVNYSKDIGGVHFQFITMWPDSGIRAWMADDLKAVPATTPVVIFTHDQPDAESKHFTNPNDPGDINATDKFENILVDVFADATTISDEEDNPIPSVIEQQALVAFLKDHKNIVAYFHGNDHINGYYKYAGPDGGIALNTFRVDSPMKGPASLKDETKLTFSVVTIDAAAKSMTVRDYQWNAKTWGASNTVSLAPRAN